MTLQVWPAERFFWAVIEAPGIRSDGTLPEGIKPMLQEDLPVPAEEVHAVGAATIAGKLLVCAARRRDLEALPSGLLGLSPEEVPALIEPRPDPATLNLLVGDFEPAPLRRERTRRRILLTLTVATLACLVAVGLSRGADAWTRAGEQARAATSSLGASPTAVHVELERLRKAPRMDAKSIAPHDAAAALASLLSAWPRELECQTDSVQVGTTTMTLSLTVAQDARPFLSALRPPEGWILEEPHLTSTSEGARLRVVLHRKEAKS
jgi:hypothetical protein